MRTNARLTGLLVPGSVIALLPLVLTVAGCASEPADYRPTATVREIMESIVDPAADAIWGAVEIVATLEGKVEKQPTTDDEWQAVRRHAVTLMEAGNLLVIPGRRVAPAPMALRISYCPRWEPEVRAIY
jgi:hypothetical protein